MTTCKNCQQPFLTPETARVFYQKFSLPEATLCFPCRLQRKYTWRNEFVFYMRPCDLCKKQIVSIYAPSKPYPVYCSDCFWSDQWDPHDYGVEFDFTGDSFFTQFAALRDRVPRLQLLNKRSINSEFTHHSGDNKNVYMSSSCFDGEDIYYSNWIMQSRDCADCTYLLGHGELCYECVACEEIYNCRNSALLFNCRDCAFCYDCRGCSDCFLSANLRRKQYCILNEQYTKEEYFKKIEKIRMGSFRYTEELLEQFWKMLGSVPHRAAIIEDCENSSGNMLFHTKNAFDCYDVSNVEDSLYCVSCLGIKDSMDCYHFGLQAELCYELHGCTRNYNCRFCHMCYDTRNTEYCDNCHNAQDLFGCVSLKSGRFCILNKKYSEKEYTALRGRIIAWMNVKQEYGSFFPPSFSPIGYNESVGMIYHPLSREAAHAKGFLWEDFSTFSFGKETISVSAIPDHIQDVPDSITTAVFACSDCQKNYRIIPSELNLYRRLVVPLPRRCFSCRFTKRILLKPQRKSDPTICANCHKDIMASVPSSITGEIWCNACYTARFL